MSDTDRMVHIITYGCQMNEHDAERMLGLLESAGFTATDDPARADLIVVNTCTVRNSADEKILGHLGYLNRYKRARPHQLLAVGGCLAQDEDGRRRIARRAPHVDIVFGTHNIDELPDLIERARELGPVTSVRNGAACIPEPVRASRARGIRAWVTITLGCDNSCAYCIVPSVRGPMRSRRPDRILTEVEDLAGEGYREIVLLGQNVNAYGQDLGEDIGFADLLRQLDQVKGLDRIRFTTSHPRDFNRELVNTVFELEHVCESFHLPVQSGSTRVLDAMNRGYDRDHYLDLVQAIRERDSRAGVSTDIIVGFPGETEADFADTLDLVERCQFDQAFTFMYSPRNNTVAAELPGQIARPLKQERLARLNEVQTSISTRRHRELVGTDVEVLVEGASKNDPGIMTGRTRSNHIVHFPPDGTSPGQLVTVRVETAGAWTLRGRPPGGGQHQ